MKHCYGVSILVRSYQEAYTRIVVAQSKQIARARAYSELQQDDPRLPNEYLIGDIVFEIPLDILLESARLLMEGNE